VQDVILKGRINKIRHLEVVIKLKNKELLTTFLKGAKGVLFYLDNGAFRSATKRKTQILSFSCIG
jgi:hypothetical protein